MTSTTWRTWNVLDVGLANFRFWRGTVGVTIRF